MKLEHLINLTLRSIGIIGFEGIVIATKSIQNGESWGQALLYASAVVGSIGLGLRIVPKKDEKESNFAVDFFYNREEPTNYQK